MFVSAEAEAVMISLVLANFRWDAADAAECFLRPVSDHHLG